MVRLIPFIFVVLSIPIPASTFASGENCFRNFVDILVPPELIATKMKDLPEMREWVEALAQDRQIPPAVRRVIKRALESDTSIRQLTEKLRQEWKVNSGVRGFNATYADEYEFMETETKTLNQEQDFDIPDGEFKSRHTVVVPDSPYLTRNQNAVITLVHELAHVKFEEFLLGHLPQLERRFPPSLIRRLENGKYLIHPHLHTFLTERYAREIEYSLLKSAYGKYFSIWYQPEIYLKGPGMATDRQISDYISDHVIHRYKITEPSVLKMRYQSISDILLPARKK